MGTIQATFIDGKFIPDIPPDWPNGKRVFVVDPDSDDELVMLTEEEQGIDPDSITRWLTWYDTLEPLIMTPV